jgi:hypothetical protein
MSEIFNHSFNSPSTLYIDLLSIHMQRGSNLFYKFFIEPLPYPLSHSLDCGSRAVKKIRTHGQLFLFPRC